MTVHALSIVREVNSLRHQVTDRLREAILSGYFEPGAKLVERELFGSLGVSRPLLREALQHLQAEGLINIVPHKGPTVSRVCAKEAQDIYAVRQNLEGLAGEGFARGASVEQVAQLRAALTHLMTPEASATTEALLQAIDRFYAILMEGCGNQVIGQMLRLLNNRVTLLRRISLTTPGRLPKSLKELDGIVRAIEARDPNRARELCAAHVACAAKVALRGIEEAGAVPGDAGNEPAARPSLRRRGPATSRGAP